MLLFFQNCLNADTIIDFENLKLYTYFDAESSVELPTQLVKNNATEEIGELRIQYQGGDWLKRNAKITTDPLNDNNKVLKFTINEANCCKDQKGRIQLNAYNLEQVKDIEYQVDMFLPKTMEALTYYPGKLNFFTISEWWNNNGWAAEYPFRISINIVKREPSKGAPLVFEVRSQIKQEELDKPWQGNIWHDKNDDITIPFGEWFTLKYVMKEGNKDNGKFSLTIVYSNSTEKEIFNINDWTHHPENPTPDGLSNLNPIKLYTSHRFINYMVYRKDPIEVYWDNLIFTKVN